MFPRTFSFWRRLVSKPHDEKAGNVGVETDRRVWVRYPANVETTLQPPGETTRFAARVRDISRGGVNLISDRAFRPGDHLSVELPAAAEQTHTVLACVVRVNAEPVGEWALGCTFSRELSDQDLEEFGARKQKPTPPDQRTWVRFPSHLRAAYQPLDDQGAFRNSQVENVSPSGIALIVDEPIETGVLLTLELHAASGTAARTILACVVHAAQQEGRWSLGCNFIRELSEEDLEVLVSA